MHYGTETGSLVNHLLSRQTGTFPSIGDPATVLHHSDRIPATVTGWDKEKQIVTLREDDATCTDFDQQTYTFQRSEFGATYHFKREKNGSWVQVVFRNTSDRWFVFCQGLVIGRREKYCDPDFE